MPSFRLWAELPPELLSRIADILDLKCYASARGCCTAWRLALAPPSPSLLLVPVPITADVWCRPSAASIPTRRAFELKAIPLGAQCVGSSSGWLALSGHTLGGGLRFSLFNPITAARILLPPLIYRGRWVSMSKLVFAPDPAGDDFAAAAICDVDTLAYVTAGARRWAVLDPVRLTRGDHLTDVVYHEKQGSVYCLTHYGDVHVLRLLERCRPKPCRTSVVVEDPWSAPAIPAPAQCFRGSRHPKSVDEYVRPRRVPPQLVEPDLNEPATVEPLLSEPFDPATSFAPPYKRVSVVTSAKNLVFCEGNLYQIWRNVSCTMTVQLPERGGRRCVAENEVFVLRYYPDRRPCWNAVTDLGGYSVFVGRNNAASIYAQGVQGLKGNSVYWIGGKGRDQGMVFDMATRKSTPCPLPPAAADGFAQQSTICWYFLSDMVN